MKLKELLLKEMPALVPKELVDHDKTHEEFKVFFMTEDNLKKQGYQVIGKKDETEVLLNGKQDSAIIGSREVRHDGVPGIQIYGQILFKETLKLGVEDKKYVRGQVLQVEIVEVAKRNKFEGIGSFLYSSLVQHGFVVISDTTQFKGGAELWKKIARAHRSNEVVYVIDHGELMMADDKPIEYDGKNIPENEIWSIGSKEKEYVLLVYMKRQ